MAELAMALGTNPLVFRFYGKGTVSQFKRSGLSGSATQSQLWGGAGQVDIPGTTASVTITGVIQLSLFRVDLSSNNTGTGIAVELVSDGVNIQEAHFSPTRVLSTEPDLTISSLTTSPIGVGSHTIKLQWRPKLQVAGTGFLYGFEWEIIDLQFTG